jgi:urease accessory protein
MKPIEPLLGDSHQQWHATLNLEFKNQQAKTLLSSKKHSGPLLVQKALYPEGDEICHAVILHPPAGIAGGDQLNISAQVHEKSNVVLTTPGATKWYKSNGRSSSQTIELSIKDGAHLDFLPQENIFFDEVLALSKLVINQSPQSSLIAWDITQLGRSGESRNWITGEARLSTEFFFDKKLVWVEDSLLKSGFEFLTAKFCLNEYPVVGTMWLSSNTANKDIAEDYAKKMVWHQSLRSGVTHLDLDDGHGLIIIRVLGDEVEDVKGLFIDAWLTLRHVIADIEPQPLRLWKT